MTTGMTAENPRFAALWEALLREVGSWLEEAARRKKGASQPSISQLEK
jgi:hypothetical protein